YRTFGYVFQCPDEDRKKVLRVLNLWSLNEFFKEDVLKPIFELAEKIEKKKAEEAEEQEQEDEDEEERKKDGGRGGESEGEDEEKEREVIGKKMSDVSSRDDAGTEGVNKDLLLQLASLQSSLASQNIGDLLTTMKDDSSNSTSLTKGIEFLLSNPTLIKQLGELQNKFSLNQIKDLESIVESSLSGGGGGGASETKKPSASQASPIRRGDSEGGKSNLLAEESEFEAFLRENERNVHAKRSNRDRGGFGGGGGQEGGHIAEVDLRSPEEARSSRSRGADVDLRSIHLPIHSLPNDISSKFNLDDISLPSNLNEIRLPPSAPPPPLPPSSHNSNQSSAGGAGVDLTSDLPMNLPTLPPSAPPPQHPHSHPPPHPIQFNIPTHHTLNSLQTNPLFAEGK
ncbi:hypothetical protein WDU94_002572, partial [Cyamophila willieti]